MQVGEPGAKVGCIGGGEQVAKRANVVKVGASVGLVRHPVEEPGPIEHQVQDLLGSHARGQRMDVIKQRQESLNRGPSRSATALAGAFGQFVNRNRLCSERVLDRAESSWRGVEDSRQGRAVGRAVCKPQVGEQVFDFGARQQVQLGAHPNGDAAGPERVRELACLGVGAE